MYIDLFCIFGSSFVKIIIMKIIDKMNDFIRVYKLKSYVISSLNHNIFSSKYKHTFYGYYDKTPFSFDNSKILAIATNHDEVLTSPKEAVVGYFDRASGEFFEIDTTTTWCWQQGCRLMWWDENCVIYNKVVDGDYGLVVYDIEKQQIIKQYNFPIYDKTYDNKYALTLNFSRLHHFRPGYGYVNFLTEEEKVKIQEKDGVFLCDFINNTKKLIISLKNIVEKDFDERMIDAYHYINHLKFSPDNKHFIFYHIWNQETKRHTRAMLANLEGDILKVFDNKTFMSHDTFKNKDELLIFTKSNQNGYHLYNFENEKVDIFSPDLQEDGHPSFISDDLILTDTYPSRFAREQRLIMADKERFKEIGKFYAPSKYKGEFRCDLHPRLSNDKKFIAIDVPFFDGRKLIVLERDNEVN